MLKRLLCLTGLPLIVLCAGCESGTPRNAPIANAFDPNDTSKPARSNPSSSETFLAQFETTTGSFTIEVHPDWSPEGAQRFRELVEGGFYDECRFFRVVPGFMVQFGMNGTPSENDKWNEFPDDPVIKSNKRGYVTFAKTGAPNSRTTQIFINYSDNSSLDSQGFSPFGIVVDGMDAVDAINAEYREQPQQPQITSRGNEYLDQNFPNLDHVKTARIITATAASAAPEPGADPVGTADVTNESE